MRSGTGLGIPGGWSSRWPRRVARGTRLVTDVGAGLEALALGLEVVLVAATAAINELLALLAGGVEEEAAEERLAAPADRGQVAEICAVRGGRAEPGAARGRRRAGDSRGSRRRLRSSGPLSPPNPSRWQPALRPPAPRPHAPAAQVLPHCTARGPPRLWSSGAPQGPPLPGALGSHLLSPAPALTTPPLQSPTAAAPSPHPAPAPGTCSHTCWGSTWRRRGSRRHRHSGSRRRSCDRRRSPRPAGPPPPGCGSSTRASLRDTAAGMLGRTAEPGAEQPPSARPRSPAAPSSRGRLAPRGAAESARQQRHPERPCPRDVPPVHSPILGSSRPAVLRARPDGAARGSRAARRRRRQRRLGGSSMVLRAAGSVPRVRRAGI